MSVHVSLIIIISYMFPRQLPIVSMDTKKFSGTILVIATLPCQLRTERKIVSPLRYHLAATLFARGGNLGLRQKKARDRDIIDRETKESY